jgi:hypothetical protein
VAPADLYALCRLSVRRPLRVHPGNLGPRRVAGALGCSPPAGRRRKSARARSCSAPSCGPGSSRRS